MLVSVRWVSAINAHVPIVVKVAAQCCNNQPFGCPSLSSPFSYSSPAQLGQLDVQALLRGPNVPGTRQESCCEPIRDGRCQRHETNETHQSRKKLGIIRHPNWCKMFIFRNRKPHPLRCSQNTCACLVQKGLQLGDALLTRATSTLW